MIANRRAVEADVPERAGLLDRIRGEYREMPCLSLTIAQARRLWTLDERTCRLALETLTQRGFLARTTRGAYVRREAGRQ